MVVDDAKYPKKRSRSSPGGNKHRLIAGDRPACVGKAVADEKMQARVGFAGVDYAAPAGRFGAKKGAKRQNNIESCAGAIGRLKTRQMTHTDHMSERTGPYEL